MPVYLPSGLRPGHLRSTYSGAITAGNDLQPPANLTVHEAEARVVRSIGRGALPSACCTPLSAQMRTTFAELWTQVSAEEDKALGVVCGLEAGRPSRASVTPRVSTGRRRAATRPRRPDPGEVAGGPVAATQGDG